MLPMPYEKAMPGPLWIPCLLLPETRSVEMNTNRFCACYLIVKTSITVLVALFLLASRSPAQTVALQAKHVSYAQVPMSFESNVGQESAETRFTASGPGYSLRLMNDRAVIELAKKRVDSTDGASTTPKVELQILDESPTTRIEAVGRLAGVSNYFPSNDRSKWQTNVPHYGRVLYGDVYPAIDLAFYGLERSLEYDFVVKAGADPGKIRIGIDGARSATVNGAGDLVLAVGEEHLQFLKPVAYQISTKGTHKLVAVDYTLQQHGDRWLLGFQAGPHDTSQALVIDPVLIYGEELVNTTSNIGAIASDTAGNLYVTGQNSQRGFYIEKFGPTGTSLFSTVIGSGLATAFPTGIAVDGSGNAYVVGYATTGLPTTAGAFENYTGNRDVPFVAVLAANGSTINYLSYLGGTSNTDYSSGIALDGTGKFYIAGYESTTNFPTTAGAYLGTNPNPGAYTAFVAKFDPTKSGAASLIYSTLLGAVGVQSFGSGIAADASGNAYVSLQSNFGYPVTAGAFSYNGSISDSNTAGAFITKVNATGSALTYSAYLGPGTANSVAVDTSGDAYVIGTVNAEDFPTTSGAYQTSYPGGFAMELNPAGSAQVYSTFLSGPSGAFSPANNNITPQQIVIPHGCASACTAYISGWTPDTDFPAVNALQETSGGQNTAFLVELAGNGQSAVYSTYLGGITAAITYAYSGPINPTPSVALDGSGNAYLAANITGPDFPTTLPIPTQVAEGYIAKVGASNAGSIVVDPPSLNFDAYNTSGQAVGVSSTLSGIPVPLVLRNLGSAPVAISSLTFTPNTEFSETDNCANTIPAGGACTLDLEFLPTASGKRTATLSIASNAVKTPVSVALSGSGEALGYLQSSAAQLNFSDEAVGSSSSQQMFTITNLGKTVVALQPISVGSVRTTWGSGSDFQVLSTCSTQLAAGASCSVGVIFTPIETGLRAALISITGNGFGNQQVSAYGTGVIGTSDGSVALSATALNFNTLLVGTTSATQSVILTNTSTTPISIFSTQIATAGQTGTSDFFILNGTCVSTSVIQIASQGTCSLNIRFTPSTAATETGTITINDSAAGHPHKVSLSGTGVAAAQKLEFSPNGSVFPDQPVGDPSAFQTFFVYNTSTGPVTIDRVLVTGDYEIQTTNCPGTILKPGPAPGTTFNFNFGCSVRVIFTPTATGIRSGTIKFIDNAGGTPQVLNLTGNGITATGSIVMEPASLTFGTQAKGTTSSSQSVSIVNPGNSPISLSNIATTGDYAILNDCVSAFPFVLAPQRSCAVNLTFTPTSTTNPRTGSLVVTSSAGTATLPITGTGVAATNAVGIAPTALNFGNVQVATTSFTYVVYFRNTGTEAVTLNSGSGATGDFAAGGGSCGFFDNTLAPGASCNVTVTFTPSATGPRTGVLTLLNSAGTITANLTGVGTTAVPTTQLIPNGAGFNNVPVGKVSSTTTTITLFNHASTTLAIKTAAISSGGSAFVIPPGNDHCSGLTIGANGGQCQVGVNFAPTAAGFQTGTLTITDMANKTYIANLAGYSPAVAVSAYLDPAALKFPGQVLTTFSNGQSISLYNTSDVPLTVGSLTGTNVAVGSVTTGPFFANANGGSDGCSGISVAPAARCSVSVVFGPSSAASARGTLVFPVTYGNGTTTQLTATFTGTGLAVKDSAELAPVSIVFPDQAVGAVTGSGADGTQVFTLYDTGNLPFTVGTLTGTNVVIGATTSGDFTTVNTFGGSNGCTGATVSPGSPCQVTVAFNPAATGAKTGKIVFPVTYSDKTTTSLTASLSGNGIAGSSKVVISPSSGQFGVQVINTTSDSSQTLSFVLSNIGNLPVKVGTSTVTTNFSFVSDGCSGTTLAVNTSCQFTLAFSPSSTGTITGTLTIPDNAAGNPHKVSLSGTGIPTTQQIVLSQKTLSFGNQVVGTKSASAFVYVSNQSGATVPISSVTVGGTNASDFIETNTCAGGSLGGHQSCTITVQFAPATTSLGARTATITEVDTAGGSPRVITLSGTGVASAPGVAFYPSSLNFGSQPLNTASASLTFSVTNTGATNLTVTKVASTNATEFKVASQSCTAQAIVPGANCLVSVVFDPNLGGTQTASIQVTDNASGSPQSLTVTGLSVGIPKAVLSPTSLTFTSQNVGSTSAAQVVKLTNSGTDVLQIAGIVVGGTNAGDFAQTNTCGTSIAAAANCSISVTFKPIAPGSRAATLTVTDNAGNVAGSTQTLAIGGTGVGVAKVTFTPTSLAFPSTNVGVSSAIQTIKLANPGSAALTITSIGVTPAGDFTQTNTCGTSLAVAGSCTVSVTFKPSVGGARAASVSVADNAAASPQGVPLTGTGIGVPQASLSTTTLAFGNQAIGVVSAPLKVTLTNTGSGPLTVASLKVSGTNATEFTATSTTCPGTLAISANCVISVTFKPTALGARSATLTITDNSGNVTNATQAVTFGGTGTGTPKASFAPGSFAFGSVAVGTSSGPLKVVLTNSGNGPLSLTSIKLTGADATDLLEFDDCPATVAPNGTCEIALDFTPKGTGARTASVVVTDNAGGVAGTTQSLPVTGTATGAPQVSLSVTSLAFGTDKVGTESGVQFVTLTNTGNATLSVSGVVLAGTNPGDFGEFDGCSTTLGGGDSCVIAAFFKPTATGARSASVTITDNANNVTGSKQTITLSGTGD